MSVADVVAGLVRSRAPARPLAIARIVLGAVALAKAADLATVLFRLADGDVLRLPYAAWIPDPGPAAARALVGIWVAAGVAFLAGWRTRWAGGLLVAAMGAVLLVDQHLYSNHFYLAVLLCFLLTVADSGAALSLDARRDGERATVPGWPVTLLKLQLSIVYGFAVVAKLNPYYLSGAVLNVHWSRYGPYALPDALRVVEVMAPLAMLALLVEALLAVGLWLPRLRHPVIALGLGLHLAIIPTMGSLLQLSAFAAMMFALYLLFLDAMPASRLVVWDDHCSFCRDWVRAFQRLDWLRIHRFEGSSDDAVLARAGIARAEADAALQLVAATEAATGAGPADRSGAAPRDAPGPGGAIGPGAAPGPGVAIGPGAAPGPGAGRERAPAPASAARPGAGPGAGSHRSSGFEAVRAILEHLPASYLWAPVLRFPPIRRLGDRAYRRVAARRSCRLPFAVEPEA